MQMKQEPLKSCPFCGDDAAEIKAELWQGVGYFLYRAHCLSCGVRTHVYDDPYTAERAWNKRDQ